MCSLDTLLTYHSTKNILHALLKSETISYMSLPLDLGLADRDRLLLELSRLPSSDIWTTILKHGQWSFSGTILYQCDI